ncbi:MAG TPA: hypothetical protein VJ276_19130 [Thermoanaerobaculia bacterium]|nr:hypothetical protein [Thermoanaerobaculia bacterium]
MSGRLARRKPRHEDVPRPAGGTPARHHLKMPVILPGRLATILHAFCITP